ncbi:protein C1orf43 homolog isoform X2 [Mixophyes fleayi]|uniref:protein C1orf43 homolog isoform X2 n=1 Tax=Mixophyes fleayi TaxID=3061075 RepID=UPI003F4DC623
MAANKSNWLSGVNVVLVMAYGSLELKEEIDNRLSKVQDIKFEPRLLAEGDDRMVQLDTPACYNYLYRMKTLDAVKDSDVPFQGNGKYPKSLVGKNFRAYLLEMRNAGSPFRGIRKTLLDTLLDRYDSARYGTGVYGKTEHEKFMEALAELSTFVKSREAGSHRQRQSAARDLTASSETPGTPTIQVTYLPSNQKTKRPKHFLELKSFKDNYNTLESTL